MDDRYVLFGVPIPGWLGDWLTEHAAAVIYWAGILTGLIVALAAFLLGFWLTFP